ncbi:Ureidoglycolate lyase [Komagataella phaffii CBS 7435]|uniref:Ureidoglycolate lyase n=2 Tax=Komagataella phaffii TaxID=460519 RepID=C4R081_KOMPG|nr:Ureidoglycolate hydrolase [Komagataella phaffii GS115]AOA63029.1 GQ67_00324T0 [Komagataella phaffii]KAI0462802.1 hypothetical protein LJB42_003603 [Komagataella kurtzmanii]CAH2448591.1 Ureidoglycolate lyase [Komagataella phaffii CBS 7435]AOA67315.1 GQ68_01065T0 [Komagataella phaffii GS115]CAY68905.1 Ureidoglycolate hydrolase [Komagataella phaffii GS115]
MVYIHKSSAKTTIPTQPLTPASFKPFGSIICTDQQLDHPHKSAANQGTAIKLFQVSQIVNNYSSCPSGNPATINWNIFRCTVPNTLTKSDQGNRVYTGKVLERHPYTTQTFLPMGISKEKDTYMVICALNDETTDQKLPDLSTLTAFICKGNQAVTYGAGVWHAPMIVLNETVDFAVLVHENDQPQENCEEVEYEGLQVLI